MLKHFKGMGDVHLRKIERATAEMELFLQDARLSRDLPYHAGWKAHLAGNEILKLWQ